MAITYSSLPKLKYFFSIFDTIKENKEIIKPWLKNQYDFELFSCSAISLYFIVKKISNTTEEENISIWIPDFFCNSSLEAIRDLNIEIIFYPINNNLTPNLEWCEINLKPEKTNIFLFVHYFGYIFNLQSVSEFCSKYKIWLIEDAAHVLLPTPEIGVYGDFIMYSPHKHLPIYDGAILIVTNRGNDKFKKSSALTITNKRIQLKSKYSEKVSKFLVFNWIIKRVIQLLGFRIYFPNYEFWPDHKKYNISFNHIRMSKISKLFLHRIAPELTNISKTRIKNCISWSEHLIKNKTEIKNVMLVDSFRVPYLAFFEISNIELMNKVFYKLKKMNFPITSWPDLPPELMKDENLHSVAIGLRKTRLYFHVHHSISGKDISKITSKINL